MTSELQQSIASREDLVIGNVTRWLGKIQRDVLLSLGALVLADVVDGRENVR